MCFIICELHVWLMHLFRRNSFVKDNFFGTKPSSTQIWNRALDKLGFPIRILNVGHNERHKSDQWLQIYFYKIHVFPKFVPEMSKNVSTFFRWSRFFGSISNFAQTLLDISLRVFCQYSGPLRSSEVIRRLPISISVIFLTHWGREGSFKLFKSPFPGF
jgi:hypothetical protein